MKEVVTFFLSGKEYGVEVSNVQGIENYAEITNPGQTPDCLTGVVMIRKEMIPVMNIKKRLVLPPAGVTAETKFMLMRTNFGKLAFAADGVSKIFKVEGEEIQTFPALMKTEATDYVDFVAKSENGLVIVINPENLLTVEEWAAINTMIDDLKNDEKLEEKND